MEDRKKNIATISRISMFTFLFNFLYYIVALVVALFILMLGIIGIILPWSSVIRTDFITLVLEHSITISLFGFAFLLIGLAVIINIWMNVKKRYFHIRVGGQLVAVDEAIIQHYLDAYWKQLYPQTEIPNRLILKRNKIRVVADLPHAPKLVQKEVLERIQSELPDILFKILGYSRELDLDISFKSKTESS
jgi:hypothetical protein